MVRFLAIFLGLFLTAALAYFCVQTYAPKIPIDIKNRTYENLNNAGIAAVGVELDGRDVTLSGIVEQEAVMQEAEKIARETEGVRVVRNKIMLVPPMPIEEEITPVMVPSVEEINQQCETRIALLLSESSIVFTLGSTRIDQESIDLLNNIANIARECPQSRILVSGYTDNTGAEAINLKLSQERAEAVADYLRNEAKLLQPVEAKGFGAAHPIASNDTKEGRRKNRRIEFSILPLE